LRRRRPTSAYIIDAVRRTRARRATPSELRHRDRLTGYALERLGDGPTVRIVELLIGVVMVRLVGVEVRKWRNSVRVWVELRGRVSRGGGCVADRVATDISGGIDARTTRAVCRQGNVRIMCVKFGPFDLLIIIKLVPPLAGKFPYEEANEANDGDAACNRQPDDGGTGNIGRAT
jgi:hypothetical protein